MSETWDKLKDNVLVILKDSLKGLIEEGDQEFLEQLAKDIATQKIAGNERNLLHLEATVKGEIARKRLKFELGVGDAVVKILGAVIKTVAIPALKAYIEKKAED